MEISRINSRASEFKENLGLSFAAPHFYNPSSFKQFLGRVLTNTKTNKDRKKYFLTFPVGFKILKNFTVMNSNQLHLRNLQEQIRKVFWFKNSSDLALFEKIVLVISKKLQILGLQPPPKVFLNHWKNNFLSKI